MDPNLFHLDWARTFEVLTAIVIMSFIVERFLSVLFEARRLMPFFAGSGMKELVAVGVSTAVCIYGNFDAVSMILLRETTAIPGEIITGGVIAGGSKASVKLFRDMLEFRSSAYEEYSELRQNGASTTAAAKAVATGRTPPPADPPKPEAPPRSDDPFFSSRSPE